MDGNILKTEVFEKDDGLSFSAKRDCSVLNSSGLVWEGPQCDRKHFENRGF